MSGFEHLEGSVMAPAGYVVERVCVFCVYIDGEATAWSESSGRV